MKCEMRGKEFIFISTEILVKDWTSALTVNL